MTRFDIIIKALVLLAPLRLPGCEPGCHLAVDEPGFYEVTFEGPDGRVTSVLPSNEAGTVDIPVCSAIYQSRLAKPPNRAPICSQARPSLAVLPNDPQNFISVSILDVTDPDNDPVSIEINSIQQDEPTGGLFGGDLVPDAQMPSGDVAYLRGERDHAGNGRVYLLGFTARDDSGMSCQGIVAQYTCVPGPNGLCVDDGLRFNSTLPPTLDLSAAISDSPDPVPLGSNLTYEMKAINPGPLLATNVRATFTLNAGAAASLVSASEGCIPGPSGSYRVDCSIATLAAGSTATFTLVVRPLATGTLEGSASVVASPSFDPNSANDRATTTTTVVEASGANLSITMTDSPDPVIKPNQLDYTIVVTNNGPSAASGVVLTDTLPNTVEVGTATTSQGTCSRLRFTLTCNLGGLTSGASATVTIPVFPGVIGTITNVATVMAAEPDPDTSNNTATQSTVVIP